MKTFYCILNISWYVLPLFFIGAILYFTGHDLVPFLGYMQEYGTLLMMDIFGVIWLMATYVFKAEDYKRGTCLSKRQRKILNIQISLGWICFAFFLTTVLSPLFLKR